MSAFARSAGLRYSVAALLLLASASAPAGNCLIQGNRTVGDCGNVTVGPSRPLNVRESGSYSGNYGRVTIQPGVQAYISGNTDDVIVRPGAMLYLSGNSDNVRVEGSAELSGNADWVTVAKGGSVVIRGIVDGVSGPGKVVKVPGAIVGGVYVTQPQPRK